MKPHPFCYVGAGLSLWGFLRRDPTTVRQPGYLPLGERSMGFAPPPHGGFAFIAAPERLRVSTAAG